MSLQLNPISGQFDSVGLTQTSADARYVKKSGDTITGQLVLQNPASTSGTGVLLKNNTTYDTTVPDGQTLSLLYLDTYNRSTTGGLLQAIKVFTNSDVVDGAAGISITNSGRADGLYINAAGKSGATASSPTGIGLDLNRGSGSGENATANNGYGIQIWDWSETSTGNDTPVSIWLRKLNNPDTSHVLLRFTGNRNAIKMILPEGVSYDPTQRLIEVLGSNGATNNLVINASGSLRTKDYLSVGVIDTTANVAAGDFTAKRLNIGNLNTFGASAGQFAILTGTATNTAAIATALYNFSPTITPVTNSGTEFRVLNIDTAINPPTTIVTSIIRGIYTVNRMRGDGIVNILNGVNANAFIVDSGSPATVQATNSYAFQASVHGRPSGTTTATLTTGVGYEATLLQQATGGLTVTNLIGFRMNDPLTGNTITNLIGFDIAALTQGSTLNVGLRIAAPSGASNNYALQLSDTGATAAGGITFGTDTQVYRSAASVLTFNSVKLSGLVDPTSAQDAATKAYVDAVATGLDIKASVRVATTANITLSGAQTIDGVSAIAGDRVLVKSQTTQADNGIYVCASGAWTRATDADTSAEVTSGMFTFVSEGTANGSNGFVLTTADPITLGSTSLTFTQFSGAGEITAGAGLTKTGNTIDAVGTASRILVNADSIDIDSGYVGQSSITTLGTITTGVWQGTAINRAYVTGLLQSDISGLTTVSSPTFAGLSLGTGNLSTIGNISVDGTAVRDITVGRATSGAGQVLLIQAGGAQSGVADTAGGELRLSSGITTGTQASVITFYTATNGSSATTDRTPSEHMRLFGSANGALGIGLTSASNISDGLNFGGTVARTVKSVRNITSNTAGNNLTIQAGGAFSTATDKAGGNLILSGGIATGTGSSKIQFQTATAQGSTNTTDNTPATLMTLDGTGNLRIGDATSPTATLDVLGKFLINSSGLTTKYNNISTVSNGIPSEVATIDTTGLTANVGATTLYATPATAGMYRVSAYVVETTAGSLSSTLPNVQIVYTDSDSNTSVTIDATPVLGVAGIGQTGALTANTVGTVSTGVIVLYVKASTTIQYQTVNYASNIAGMTYALRLKLEAM